MNFVNSRTPMDSIADVLGAIRKKGVMLWLENGQLRYRAPKGALTFQEIEKLTASRRQIIAFLDETNSPETVRPTIDRCARLHSAPVAFSQLAHLHAYRLSERQTIRQIASATHLRGPLNIELLQTSFAEVLRRHDALRTRIVIGDEGPMQEISESSDCKLEVFDLRSNAEIFREIEVNRLTEQLIMEPIDIATGPLFGARLLRLTDDEHVLILAMEHMISDGASLYIVLRDLCRIYMQAAGGHASSLPEVAIQFADYAIWQRNTHADWLQRHGAYWNERLAGCERLKFPQDSGLPAVTQCGWGTVPIKIGNDLKRALHEWCRLRQTTVVMSIFTAYVGLVLRWCDVSETLIQYVSDGRVNPEFENTVGFFASVLYLRIGMLKDDSFVDLMDLVLQEYCRAYDNADCFYMAAQVPRPEFTRNTSFNWLPQGSHNVNAFDLDGSEGTLTCSRIHFTHPMLRNLELDEEPFVMLGDTDDEIIGDLYFPLGRFSVETMEKFVRCFLVFIRELLRRPEQRVKGISLL